MHALVYNIVPLMDLLLAKEYMYQYVLGLFSVCFHVHIHFDSQEQYTSQVKVTAFPQYLRNPTICYGWSGIASV